VKIEKKDVPIVILCGGKGLRLREETELKPKPLIEIGGKPILWHIMKIYSTHGFNNFILCLGYKGHLIKEYFLNYEFMSSDFRIQLDPKGKKIQLLSNCEEVGWKITLADTGEESMTGARLKKVEKYIKGEVFGVTYGDGVANIDLEKVFQFHLEHKKIGTITGVNPSSRFGELVVKGNRVTVFNEKPQVAGSYINGGFFFFNRRFFSYLFEEESCTLEREPLEKLAKDGELMVYRHHGFWQCMDTYRDLELLNRLWKSNKAEWKIW